MGAVIAMALAGGCSPKVLIAVGPCPDGGGANVPSSCTHLLDDLVGYWRLDESSGSTVARDWSGHGNDGTLVDFDPSTAWGPGRNAGGLGVEAAGFVNVVDSGSIDSITDQVTIAGWAYLEGTINDYATVASRENGTTIDQHYHIGIYGHDVEDPTCFIMTDAGTSRLQAPAVAPRQTWIHIACTYDGATAALYVDGQQVYSEPRTGRFLVDMTPFILGANGNGPTQADVSERFPGRIDEVMLYRRALGAAEIAQLHDGALFVSP